MTEIRMAALRVGETRTNRMLETNSKHWYEGNGCSLRCNLRKEMEKGA